MKNKQKYLAFLLSVCPVILIAILVAVAIQSNSPVLREIPNLLTINVKAKENTVESETTEISSSEESVAGQFKDGEYIGKGTGYGGTITVKVTVKNHSIVSIKILDASKETASFFNRAKAVIDKVIKSQTWKVDVVSGATYSSKGILAAIQNALTGESVDTQTASTTEKKPINKEQFKEPDGYKDGSYTGSARGFGGTVSVKVTIKDGKITSISIINAANETPSYFAKAKAVISRILKSQTPNVDTVSGATYSSNGIINAVKEALKKAAGTSSSTETPKQEEQPSEKESKKPAVSKDGYKNGTYTGTARGYGGNIVVKVIVKKNKISSIKIVSAKKETPSFLKQAKAVIARIISKQGTNVDVVSGATYSSTGIINAVSNALKNATLTKETTKETTKEVETETTTKKATPTKAPGISSKEYKDGSYTGTGEGFGGDIVVKVTVKNKKITAIKIVEAFDETPEYLNEAKAVINRILKAQSTAVDAVSGATYSSNGIINAVSDALKKAIPKKETETSKPKPTESSSQVETSTKEPETSTEKPLPKYKDGTYVGMADCKEGNTFNYDVYVEIVVLDGKIVQLNATKPNDNSSTNNAYFKYAIKGRRISGIQYIGVVDQILEKQSTDNIDVVSKATYSSKSIIKAATNALEQARIEQ